MYSGINGTFLFINELMKSIFGVTPFAFHWTFRQGIGKTNFWKTKIKFSTDALMQKIKITFSILKTNIFVNI